MFKIACLLLLALVVGIIWWGRSRPASEELLEVPASVVEEEAAKVIDEPIVGGDRDEHGCLGPAGYGWDEEVGACIRVWELDENKRRAARIAVDYIGQKEGLIVEEVLVARCLGCFTVIFDVWQEKVQVNLENWEVKQ